MSKLEGDLASVKITRIEPESGKEIRLIAKEFDGRIDIPLDVRCPGNTDEDKYCKVCTLRFRCATSDALRIEIKELNEVPVFDGATISDVIQNYLAKHGMRLTITKACAIIEENEATPDKPNGDARVMRQ